MIDLTSLVAKDSSPAGNIAIEEGLRAMLKLSLLEGQYEAGFISTYINKACVVVGRNQDATSELSDTFISSGGAVYRRTSGGGAVYHDEGNLNWSFVVPGSLPQRDALLELILEALRSVGVKARAGNHGEIISEGRKIGGTASAAGGGVLLFHGTILVRSELDSLQRSLGALLGSYSSTAVRSIPYPVANASDFAPGLLIEDIQQAILTLACTSAHTVDESILSPTLLTQLHTTYSSEEWILKRKEPHDS